MATKFSQDFIEALLKSEGLDGADQSFGEQLATQLDERLGLWTMQQLNEKQMGDYLQLVAKKVPDAELGTYLQNNIADFPAKRQQMLTQYVQEFSQRTQAMRSGAM